MRALFQFVTGFSLLILSHSAIADTISNPNINGYQLTGGGNAARNAQQYCVEKGYLNGQPLNEGLILGMGGADWNGFSWNFVEPQISVRYPKLFNVECSGRPNPGPGFGPGPGRGPGPGFGPGPGRGPGPGPGGPGPGFGPGPGPGPGHGPGPGFGPGPGRGPGPGPRYPDQTFDRPNFYGYPIMADEQSADAYCQQQRYRRGQILQNIYVDTNPAYYFRNGQWNYSPNADHYYMIGTLGCFRR